MMRIARFVSKLRGDTPEVDVSEQDGVRNLHLGSNTIQSAMRVAAPFDLELTYTRGMMCFLLFTRTARTVLMIGLGGGSLPKFIHHYIPEMCVTALELNPAVIDAARNQFFLPPDDDRFSVIEIDGAIYIGECLASHDVIMLDAYDSTGLAPDLSAQDFYDKCHRALTVDGVLVVNLWGSDKQFDVYLQRIEKSFDGAVLRLPTGHPGNIVVFAFKRHAGDLRLNVLRDLAKRLEATMPVEFGQFFNKLYDYNLHSENRLIV
jgi:spermidine synthase